MHFSTFLPHKFPHNLVIFSAPCQMACVFQIGLGLMSLEKIFSAWVYRYPEYMHIVNEVHFVIWEISLSFELF